MDNSPLQQPATRDEIVLIGPMGAGKSTQAQLLAKATGQDILPLDSLRAQYFPPQGLTLEWLTKFENDHGFKALNRELKQYEIVMVEQALVDHKDVIFDFGAGHASYFDPEHQNRIKNALLPFKHVILLLPCDDVLESMLYLNRHSGDYLDADRLDVNRHILTDPEMRAIATTVIHTKDATPEETTKYILNLAQTP